MKPTQENKYMIVDGEGNPLPEARIANRETGDVIPDEEPIILFRGKDKHAVTVINSYAAMCRNDEHYAAVEQRVQQFREFQNENPSRVREPD